MSVHVAVSGWLLGAPSGANRRLLALLAELGPLLQGNERITVLHCLPNPPQLDGIAWHRVEIPPTPSWRRWLAERHRIACAVRACSANLLDHGFMPVPRLPIPVVWTLHDLRGPAGLTRWPRAVARHCVRASAQRAAAVVVPSAWTESQLRHLAPQARVQQIANGVDLPLPPPSATPRGPLLHVGHLEPRKNLALLLHALQLLPPDSRPELRLVGRDAGAGASLRQLAKQLGLANRVTFCGAVAEADLAQEYAAARAILVPSLHEGFGLAALEGLAHGKPTLVAAAGALPEVVGMVGEVLPPHAAPAWAHAIATLTERESSDAPGRRRAWAARFRWRDSAAQLLALWRDCRARAVR